jgi:penicillin-binding protein 1A
MNPELQRLAERTVRDGIEKLDHELGYLGALSHLPKAEAQARIDQDRARTELQAIEAGTLYQGVVTAARAGSMTVTVGPHTAMVETGSTRWHPSIDPSKRRFAVGDVVEVTPTKADPAILKLTQTPKVAAALVVIDPRDGAVKALVGGHDFGQSQFNRATQAYRQPGSAFKPFVYSAALDLGYTPASIILDAPIEFLDHGRIWRPQNFSRRFYGPTTLRRALEQSQNVVTVRVVRDLGVNAVAKYVNAHFTFSRPVGRNLSLGLGTSEVTPLELASAYSAFANGGRKAEPLFIKRIEDSDGNLIEENTGKITDTISPQTAYLITSLLEGVVQNGTGRGARALSRPVAGKTGTTNEQVDAWFVGYTPDLLTTVWIGYDDNRSLGPQITGGRVATPLWTSFMREALEGQAVTDFEMPDGIRCVNVDPESGLRARASTMRAYLECFKDGSEPREFTPEWRYEPPPGAEVLVHDDGTSLPAAQPLPAGAGIEPLPVAPDAGVVSPPPAPAAGFGMQPTAPSVLPPPVTGPSGDGDAQGRGFEPLAAGTSAPRIPAPVARDAAAAPNQIFQ